MKDIVENRNKIGLASKVRLALIAFRENGFLYLFYLGISYLGDNLGEFGFRRSDELRRSKGLPGLNSRAANKYIWDKWDWSAGGDEWTPSDAWKESVVRNFIDPYFNDVESICEIGPGAGRWTEYLLPGTNQYVGIDISETCIAECRKRFSSSPKALFEVGNGLIFNQLPLRPSQGFGRSMCLCISIVPSSRPMYRSLLECFSREASASYIMDHSVEAAAAGDRM